MIYVDNSRRAAAEKCRRKRWWGYEYRGGGIELARKGKREFPLLTGTGIHTVIEEVLRGRDVDSAVGSGLDVYCEFRPDDDRDRELVEEQKALIEALGRAWDVLKKAQFLEMFEVLDIEREETFELAPGIQWMSRPDLLVRRKDDGAIFIYNLKSVKEADERWVAQWPLDMQTLSEVVAVEHRLTNQVMDSGAVVELPIKLSGVVILGLVKGKQLEYPKGSGLWYHNNPLIWAWRNESGKPHPLGEWSARWEWKDEEGNHTLGRGWRKREVWLHYPGGVKGWVGRLAQADPAILEGQIVQLPPVLRNEAQIEEWKDSTIFSEEDIRDCRWDVAVNPRRFDMLFPKSTSAGNCLWPTKCAYFGICHEGVDPDGELYQPRRLNHPQEKIDELAG